MKHEESRGQVGNVREIYQNGVGARERGGRCKLLSNGEERIATRLKSTAGAV